MRTPILIYNASSHLGGMTFTPLDLPESQLHNSGHFLTPTDIITLRISLITDLLRVIHDTSFIVIKLVVATKLQGNALNCKDGL